MKITVITSPFHELPPMAIGAVEKLFYQLAGEWANNGNEVAFVCCGGGEGERIKFVRIKKYNRTGSTKKDILWDLLYSIKALWKCPKTDILLCNTFWTPALAPLFRWKYKQLVYGVHRYPKGQFWLYPFVHAFICVSTAVEEELKRQIGTKRNIVTINNPVDMPHTSEARRYDGIRHSFTIVYAGRVHPEKGLDLLVEAIAMLVEKGCDVKLKIIGTTDVRKGGGGEEFVQQLIKQSGKAHIDWMGAIYNPDRLAQEIATGDCFVYPSVAELGETFGVAPLEAMALGLPVVLSDLKCFCDFAESGVNSLQFARGNDAAQQLAGCIEWLLKNPDAAHRLAENGMRTAKMFAATDIAAKYETLFKKVLANVATI